MRYKRAVIVEPTDTSFAGFAATLPTSLTLHPTATATATSRADRAQERTRRRAVIVYLGLRALHALGVFVRVTYEAAIAAFVRTSIGG